jgi:hydrogenase maturation factor
VSVTSQSSARVRTATGVVDCDTTLVAPVRPGDLVLVHAGLAIAVDGR